MVLDSDRSDEFIEYLFYSEVCYFLFCVCQASWFMT